MVVIEAGVPAHFDKITYYACLGIFGRKEFTASAQAGPHLQSGQQSLLDKFAKTETESLDDQSYLVGERATVLFVNETAVQTGSHDSFLLLHRVYLLLNLALLNLDHVHRLRNVHWGKQIVIIWRRYPLPFRLRLNLRDSLRQCRKRQLRLLTLMKQGQLEKTLQL